MTLAGLSSPPPPSVTAPAVHAAVSAFLASTARHTRLTGFPHIAAARAAVAALDGAPEGWAVTATAGGRSAQAYVSLAKRHAEPAAAAAAATATGPAVRAPRGGGKGRRPPVCPTLDVAAPAREGSPPSPWAEYVAADATEVAVVANVTHRDVARSPVGTADAAGSVDTTAAAASTATAPSGAAVPTKRRTAAAVSGRGGGSRGLGPGRTRDRGRGTSADSRPCRAAAATATAAETATGAAAGMETAVAPPSAASGGAAGAPGLRRSARLRAAAARASQT